MPELLHPGVYVQEVPPSVLPIEGVSTSTAAFIGIAEKGPIPGPPPPVSPPSIPGPRIQPQMVTSFSEYARVFGGFLLNSFLTYAANAFFANGGLRLYVVRVAAPGALPAGVDIPAPAAAAPMSIVAKSAGVWGNNLRVAILGSSEPNPEWFKLQVLLWTPLGTEVVESFDNLTFWSQTATSPPSTLGPPDNYARTTVNGRSEFITIQGEVVGVPTPTSVPSGEPLQGGSDGSGDVDFMGNEAQGTGLHALDRITDVNLVAIPGRGDVATVNAGMEYCKNRKLQDCFFIGDVGSIGVGQARMPGALPDIHDLQDVRDFATSKQVQGRGAQLDRSAGDFGAIYHPWVWSTDPRGAHTTDMILLPPSGFMAGIYARIDNSRGVFKSAAGTEAGVFGALAPAETVTDSDQDELNPINVNVIRTVPTSGIVAWGARTIGSNPGWRYIAVRRMAIFLRTSIYYGIQWAVFEPNDEPLWANLRLNIRSFMLSQFRAGAFQGSTPDQAFFVKCDSTTTTQTDIDNGVVNILVGFAPLKPAEFVVLKLSQKVNQSAQ